MPSLIGEAIGAEHPVEQLRIIGEIRNIETIASGRSVQVRQVLRQRFGAGYWRKMKGLALVELDGG